MRERGCRVLLFAAIALAPGCGTSADAQPAPVCTDEVGCPEGARCVDQVRCEREGDGPFPSDPPRVSGSVNGASDIPPDETPLHSGDMDADLPRLDGGIGVFDGGRSGFDAGRFGFDAAFPVPGCDACLQ